MGRALDKTMRCYFLVCDDLVRKATFKTHGEAATGGLEVESLRTIQVRTSNTESPVLRGMKTRKSRRGPAASGQTTV